MSENEVGYISQFVAFHKELTCAVPGCRDDFRCAFTDVPSLHRAIDLIIEHIVTVHKKQASPFFFKKNPEFKGFKKEQKWSFTAETNKQWHHDIYAQYEALWEEREN